MQQLNQNKIIRGTRLSITCIGLFLLTWYFQVPEREWSLVTVWFVMLEYSYVGGVLKKGLFRFLGTLFSGLYGLCVVYYFNNNVIINMVALSIGVFVYAHYFLDSDKNYIAVIGCVTLTIVLLNHNALDAAILRTLNISIGILASLFMIYFFMPEYARDEIMIRQFQMLDSITQLLQQYLSSLINESDLRTFERKMLKEFTGFPSLLDQAQLETKNSSPYIQAHQQLFQQIRKIFRVVMLLIEGSPLTENESAILQQFFLNMNIIKNALIGISDLPPVVKTQNMQEISFSASLINILNKEFPKTYEATHLIIETDHIETYAKNVRQIYDN